MGLVVTRYDTACRRRISYSQDVRAGDLFFQTQIPFIWTCYVYFNRLGPTYATRRLHVEFFFIKVHFITTTRPISILLDMYSFTEKHASQNQR